MSDDDMYDDLNSYSNMSSDYSGDEDWDAHGFSVEDATDNAELSAEELIAQFGEDKESPNPEVGMATAGNLLLGRSEPL
ncbi:MAG: hypothetical protein JKY93_02340, partial [Gammaproteobacteria bacterium]|nr:hypothetical protein [Gammaproteobacteria bacterium]